MNGPLFGRIYRSDENKIGFPGEGDSMPLLDHFHPPLLGHRHWEGFHGWWAAEIAGSLNESLPDEYCAEFQVTLGARVEVDVATFEEATSAEAQAGGASSTSVLSGVWAPAA